MNPHLSATWRRRRRRSSSSNGGCCCRSTDLCVGVLRIVCVFLVLIVAASSSALFLFPRLLSVFASHQLDKVAIHGSMLGVFPHEILLAFSSLIKGSTFFVLHTIGRNEQRRDFLTADHATISRGKQGTANLYVVVFLLMHLFREIFRVYVNKYLARCRLVYE